MSQFIGFLPPPGALLAGYDSAQLHSHQVDDKIPEVFRDAMSVREEVYVDEQQIPLENEFDSDDARSWHWVAYASVGTSGNSAGQDGDGDRKSSTANQLAVGTIRLVPPPHPPHPEPGSSHKIDNAEGAVPDTDKGARAQPGNGKEPYIKFGRLAVLKPFRGLGLSHLLVNAALSWATEHQDDILPPMSPTAAEHRKLELGVAADEDDHWRGLVLIHAQKAIADKFWAKLGFVRDLDMGEWDEEGIVHVGMWRRLELRPQRRPSVMS